MNKHLYFLSLLCALLLSGTLSAQKIKVACIGNSITEGIGASSSNFSYPTILQQYLGASYQVGNFGRSGHTMLKKGVWGGNKASYWDTSQFADAKNFAPDVVIIKLGTNDCKDENKQYRAAEFVSDYTEMVEIFQNLSSKPKVYICYPIPLYAGNSLGNNNTILTEMMPYIDQVAQTTGATVVDMYTPMVGRDAMVPDKIHPNDEGYKYLAYFMANAVFPEVDLSEIAEELFVDLTTSDLTDRAIRRFASEAVELDPLFDNDHKTLFSIDYKVAASFGIELFSSTKVMAYSLTAGVGDNKNYPKSWVLEGSTDGKTWTAIDQRSDISFMTNETKLYALNVSFATMKAYTQYRLRVTANNGGDKLEIAEWQLHGTGAAFAESIMQNGGVLTAQHAGLNNEGYINLNDRNALTKYCTGIAAGRCWMQYQSAKSVVVTGYALTSANDAPERDPKAWTLYGSNNGTTWDILDVRTDEKFPARFTTRYFSFPNAEAYTYYKLDITEVPATTITQLAEWQLYAAWATATTTVGDAGATITLSDRTLFVSSPVDSTCDIVSIGGQLLVRTSLKGGDIFHTDLESGIYLVHTNDGQSVRKVIVK